VTRINIDKAIQIDGVISVRFAVSTIRISRIKIPTEVYRCLTKDLMISVQSFTELLKIIKASSSEVVMYKFPKVLVA